LSVCHHGKAAIVASKADAYEPFVFHPRAQAQGTEITQVDAAPGQSFVELHHERLVFWTNRAKRDRGSVLQAAFRDILDGIRTNRWPRQMVRLDGGIMNHNPRIQRQQALRSRQQRIDIDFLNPWLLDDELTEADQYFFESSEIYRFAAMPTAQGFIDSCLLHHPLRQCRIQWWQTQGVVAVNLNHDTV